MTFSQRFALGFFFGIVVLATGYVGLARRRSAAGRVPGVFAPYQAPRKTELVGFVSPARLTSGPIIAIADDGQDVFLLQNHGWTRVGRAGTHGPFGSRSRGGEGWIQSAADFAIDDSCVYILDRSIRSIHVFNKNGKWQNTFHMAIPPSWTTFTAEHMLPQAGGYFVVTGFRRVAPQGPVRVLLRGARDGEFKPIYATPATLLSALVVASARERIRVIDSGTYHVIDVAPDGSVLRDMARLHALKAPLPDTLRRSLAAFLARLPDSPGSRMEPPDYFPIIAGASEISPNATLTSLVTAVDSAWVELIDGEAKPIATLTQQPIALPLGLSKYGIVSLREDAQGTFVERRRF